MLACGVGLQLRLILQELLFLAENRRVLQLNQNTNPKAANPLFRGKLCTLALGLVLV